MFLFTTFTVVSDVNIFLPNGCKKPLKLVCRNSNFYVKMQRSQGYVYMLRFRGAETPNCGVQKLLKTKFVGSSLIRHKCACASTTTIKHRQKFCSEKFPTPNLFSYFQDQDASYFWK